MPGTVDQQRRTLLRGMVTSMAAVPLTLLGETAGRRRREIAALEQGRQWLNSPPLSAADLQGKIVLVDFCTFTCINWLRTLPYRRAWAAKYASGVVLVGVHTPEFGFEHDVDNVRHAMRQMAITYPIVLDNNYAIWRAFRNHHWPALYFMDVGGRIRDHQFGEGEYARCEQTIQRLLAETGRSDVPGDLVNVKGAGSEAAADWDALRSAETYFGHDRAQAFASPGGLQPERRRTYAAPARLALNEWGLGGEWAVSAQAAVLHAPGGRIVCGFHARDVHLVAGPPRDGRPVRVRVSLDGQPPGAARGADIDEAGRGTLSEQRLHQLIRQPGSIRARRFDIEFLDAGVEAYAFTFG